MLTTFESLCLGIVAALIFLLMLAIVGRNPVLQLIVALVVGGLLVDVILWHARSRKGAR